MNQIGEQFDNMNELAVLSMMERKEILRQNNIMQKALNIQEDSDESIHDFAAVKVVKRPVTGKETEAVADFTSRSNSVIRPNTGRKVIPDKLVFADNQNEA